MAGGSKTGKASRKPAAKAAAAQGKKPPLPTVTLTKELSLDLYAASPYLGSEAEKRLHLTIPFDVILQDPQVLKENPDLATDDEFLVKWEPGILDGPTVSARACLQQEARASLQQPHEVRPAS